MPRNTRAEFGVAYGLITDGGLGVLLLALPGSVWWIVFLPSLGLLIGLLVAGVPARTSRHARR